MRLPYRTILVASLVAVTALSGRGGRAGAGELPAGWDRGFNFTAWAPHAYDSATADASLRQLRATGADSIAIIPTWYQASPDANTMAPDPARSPTDGSIAAIVRRAHAAGLKVFMRPVVDDQGDTPRLYFQPTSPREWFASYRRFINHYAALAERLGVDMLSVGHEYHQLDGPHYTSAWLRVIAGVRRRFHGRLTYGANSDDAWTRIGFWHALDVIGIDAYFPLSNGGTPEVAEIAAAWSSFTDGAGSHHYLAEMAALAARYGKPIVFTEVGYPSTPHALERPWTAGSTYAATPQRRAYEALFAALHRRCWLRGMYIWDWPVNLAYGGRGDPGFTPRGKPAEDIIRAWYSGRARQRRGRCAP